jgi:ATP-dependent DNA helicase RecQ
LPHAPKQRAVRERNAPRERGAPPEPADVTLGPEDARLFAALRALRSEIARTEQVPAYVVFADRTLAEFALRRPRTLAAMSAIRGVGPAKLEKYGDRFADVIRDDEGTEAA